MKNSNVLMFLALNAILFCCNSLFASSSKTMKIITVSKKTITKNKEKHVLALAPDYLIDGEVFSNNFPQNTKSRLEFFLDIGEAFLGGIYDGLEHLAQIVLHPYKTIKSVLRFCAKGAVLGLKILARSEDDMWVPEYAERFHSAAKDCAAVVLGCVKIFWYAIKKMSAAEAVRHSVALAVEFYATGKCLHAIEKLVKIVRFRNAIATLDFMELSEPVLSSGRAAISNATEAARVFASHGRSVVQSALGPARFSSGYLPFLRASVPIEHVVIDTPFYTKYNFIVKKDFPGGSLVLSRTKCIYKAPKTI